MTWLWMGERFQASWVCWQTWLTRHTLTHRLFGFSFDASRGLRKPFDELVSMCNASGVPIVALDVPSGAPVNGDGDATNSGAGDTKIDWSQRIRADVLISLTAPKLCARSFQGRHFLGCRFVPPALQKRFALNLPAFPAHEPFVELPRPTNSDQ